ncbi:hypothetical protein BACI9J_130861 [Bacillus altitudinis]|nr:hypothetical protein SAMN05880584_101256 [Bacillus altitudinis]VXB42637.1 hypothetical protein BACI9J_130861 [Bacillus altitudinis]
MNEINESTTFGQSKYIPSYLKQFKGENVYDYIGTN